MKNEPVNLPVITKMQQEIKYLKDELSKACSEREVYKIRAHHYEQVVEQIKDFLNE